nr:hypothetical protein [Methanocella paludicola]
MKRNPSTGGSETINRSVNTSIGSVMSRPVRGCMRRSRPPILTIRNGSRGTPRPISYSGQIFRKST